MSLQVEVKKREINNIREKDGRKIPKQRKTKYITIDAGGQINLMMKRCSAPCFCLSVI